MKSSTIALVLSLALAACGKGSSSTGGTGSATGSGTTGSAAPTTADAAGSGSDNGFGGSDGSAAATGSGSAAGSGSGSATEVAFDDSKNYPHHPGSTFDALDMAGKEKVMKEQVMPAMKKAFQEFDAKDFAEFKCKTCHGEKARETHFAMPNPELPKLDFAALKEGKQKPEMAKFMMEHVKPDMAKILGATEYDEKHQDGFGCLDCHVAKE